MTEQADLMTDYERYMLEYQERFERAQAAIGVDMASRRIMRVLTLHPGPWPVRTLAGYLCEDRGIIGRRLKYLASQWMVSQSKAGFEATVDGVRRFLMIHRETTAIARGEAVGYSDDMIGWRIKCGVKVDAVAARNMSNAPIYRRPPWVD